MKPNNALLNMIEVTRQNGELYRNSQLFVDRKLSIENYKPKVLRVHESIRKFSTEFYQLKSIGWGNTIYTVRLFEMIKNMKDEISRDYYNLSLLTSVELELNRLYKELFESWHEYIESEIKSTESVLTMTKNLMNVNIKNRFDEFLLIINSPGVATKKQINAISEYKALGNKYIDDLGLNKQVIDFLKIISEKGYISVQDLNDEVLKWLKEKNYSSLFRITLSKM